MPPQTVPHGELSDARPGGSADTALRGSSAGRCARRHRGGGRRASAAAIRSGHAARESCARAAGARQRSSRAPSDVRAQGSGSSRAWRTPGSVHDARAFHHGQLSASGFGSRLLPICSRNAPARPISARTSLHQSAPICRLLAGGLRLPAPACTCLHHLRTSPGGNFGLGSPREGCNDRA